MYVQKMSGFSSFETSGKHSNSSCTIKAFNNFALRIQNLGYETGKLITIYYTRPSYQIKGCVIFVTELIHSFIHSERELSVMKQTGTSYDLFPCILGYEGPPSRTQTHFYDK